MQDFNSWLENPDRLSNQPRRQSYDSQLWA